jgi:hypothetical protein
MHWFRLLGAEVMLFEREAPGSRHGAGSTSEKRRSLFRRVFRGIGWLSAGPIDWVGLRGISRGASFIRGLSVTLRTGARCDPRCQAREDGSYDLEATAFLHGISLLGLERGLKGRQRQTARVAYATFALGCIFLTAWMCEALLSPWTAMRVVLALEFLPFCALFFLLGFYNALLNFQIRIGRPAGWREYLTTDAPFWPR